MNLTQKKIVLYFSIDIFRQKGLSRELLTLKLELIKTVGRPWLTVIIYNLEFAGEGVVLHCDRTRPHYLAVKKNTRRQIILFEYILKLVTYINWDFSMNNNTQQLKNNPLTTKGNKSVYCWV